MIASRHSFLGSLVALMVAAGFAACSAGDDGSSLSGNTGGSTAASGGGSGAATGASNRVGETNATGSSNAMFNFGSNSGGTNTGMTGGSGMVDIADKGPNNIDECPGAISPDQANQLQAGGGAGQLTYPYEGTVFARGLVSPVLQWQGASADAVYLKMQSANFSYQGCFGAQANARLQVPQDPWQYAGNWSNGVTDPLNVTVSVLSGGNVTTMTRKVSFALATIKGAIYYNTYNSPLAYNNGAVLKIVPGQAQPIGFLTEMGAPPFGPCVSCHSLSADGSTMTANRHLYPGSYESLSYDVTAQSPQLVKNGIVEAGFAGIFPDGTRAMTNGPPNASTSPFFPVAPGNVPALVGPAESRLIDPRTGQQIPAAGWDGEVSHAQMPMFSPNGRMIVYNDYDKGQGHSLWIADFDPATNTFSNKRELFNSSDLYPGWPFFTPDSKAVVFALGTRSDFVSQLPNPVTIFPPDETGRSHLEIVYIDSPNQATPLDLANGWRGGQSYLPNQDNDLEFFPTVSPVAAGGYFWVFFTSRRTYGNLQVKDYNDSTSKKIWVTAIDIGGGPGRDPSHPAFYLPGQELESGNIRAFAALEPCKEDGSSCTSGTECCSGFCIDGKCQPPQECANLDDKCEEDSDCCNSRDRCIGGYCALPVPE